VPVFIKVMEEKKRRIRLSSLTWVVLTAVSIVFYLTVILFVVFPDKYKLPLLGILAAVVALLGFFSRRKPYKKHTFVSIINITLSVLMGIAIVYLPFLENQIQGIFISGNASTSTVKINCYVMTSDYKNQHTDVFTETSTSENITDYIDSTFIGQTSVDQDNQNYALREVENKLGSGTITVLNKEDIPTAVQALYENEGEVLIMNESYEATVEEITGLENFSTDTEVIYTVERAMEADISTADAVTTEGAFVIFLAGEDTRTGELSIYGRTDVNMLLAVNPSNHQILQVSIPRDYYIYNPALEGLDKLTHLGNNGIENTLDGINAAFGLDVQYYMVVTFSSFYNIINAIGGIDIYNPYEFSTEGSNGTSVQSGSESIGGSYTFPEGTIHLDGDMALSYVRERFSLTNGDYDRNEHESIVIQGIIDKLTSSEVLANVNDLMSSLQGQVLTNLSTTTIYGLAEQQISEGGSWNMIRYHLGGTAMMAGTASMGWNRKLYVVEPFDSQIQFVYEQVNKVLEGETIGQETLPDEDQTTYIEN
jgi:LCP family protein required for cell wall assembly